MSLGEIGQEMESKWNTKIDKVYPEFSKVKNDFKALEEENARLKAPKAPVAPQEGEEVGLSDEDIAKAKKEARKIGIVTDEAFDEFMNNKLENTLYENVQLKKQWKI